ncbi:MAG: hypothetical protein A3C84_02475 [Candidatus Ryanbacteria bacterium RIFCSPHIGHO2_02_FULL_48_12]|uniref:Nucleotidase n=1 Tax=Candidatus Ryanbacteria bacterium RIFCSPHIGHO2_01_FULL_48_27 TaxID=1802115 RepID=A0A1G2G6G8_9BACT|nr:MAG: hypothetical protein A2756_02075 [Candidatus Ryanbacteria bacterium RIFCSPHIGHO2_01_FULL_48_27]OGZ50172.1 MAG: hypothetical protein A3C84_02475 [Candidatus Ryanbacteria bacterium RIFCSPHIGHO2_02_FULL_48_12]
MDIGFDLDNTIIDHDWNVERLARTLGRVPPGQAMTREFLRSWLSKEAYQTLKQSIYKAMTLEARVMDGSREIISRIIDAGTEVYIISRRPPEFQSFAIDWLRENMPFIPERQIIFTANDQEKGLHCTKLGLRFFLDDTHEVLAHIQPPTAPILFDRMGEQKNSPFQRVTTWQEFYTLIEPHLPTPQEKSR